jgi:hypothetical protein
MTARKAHHPALNESGSSPEGTKMIRLFEQFMERDASTRDQLMLLAQRQSDQNSVLQGIQMEVQRLVKNAEAQTLTADRLVVLQERQASHADTFSRAFTEINTVKADLTGAVNALGTKIDVATSSLLTYRGGLSAVKWIMAFLFPALLTLIGFTYATISDRIASQRRELEEKITAGTAERVDLRAQVRELQKTKELQ